MNQPAPASIPATHFQTLPRVAIVTGGGTGVGRATSLGLARLGCAVLVNYSRSKSEAEKTVAEITAAGGRAVAWLADVADDAAVKGMVAETERQFGPIDLLVNNAAVTRFITAAQLDEVTDDDWHRILQVNLIGPFHCARAVRDSMQRAGGGQIINVSSVASFSGKGSSFPYSASKAALNNLTVGLARSLAPQIRVNAVAPGFITGRWLEQGFGDSYPAVKRHAERRSPLGKVCTPDDVAATILAIATGSPLMTGQILVVDGGMLIGN